MDWREAKENTLRDWRQIRDAIGTAEEIDLITDINAVCDLCQMASAEAAGTPDRCGYCRAFQQAGGCKGASLAMTELVVDQDWDGLRAVVDDFITALERVELGAGSQGPL